MIPIIYGRDASAVDATGRGMSRIHGLGANAQFVKDLGICSMLCCVTVPVLDAG